MTRRLITKLVDQCVERFELQSTDNSYRRGPGLKVIKVSCSTDVRLKFILLINVEMPTIVCILTLISRINTKSAYFKAGGICQYYSFYEQLKNVL